MQRLTEDIMSGLNIHIKINLDFLHLQKVIIRIFTTILTMSTYEKTYSLMGFKSEIIELIFI